MASGLLDLAFTKELKANIYRFILTGSIWQRFNSHALLSSWQRVKLSKSQKPNIPRVSGVYSLLVHQNIAGHPYGQYVMYVGQTDNLWRRFGEYLSKEKRLSGRPLVVQMLNDFPDDVYFVFSQVALKNLTVVENNLLESFIPPCCDPDKMPAGIRKSVKAAKLS